jgi:hypothetical protein
MNSSGLLVSFHAIDCKHEKEIHLGLWLVETSLIKNGESLLCHRNHPFWAVLFSCLVLQYYVHDSRKGEVALNTPFLPLPFGIV